MENQEFRNPTRVAIVAPIWLQNVLSLWLQCVGKIEVVICSVTFEPLSSELVPDLLILSAEVEPLLVQVEEVKALWPTTYLLVLCDSTEVELLEAGADMVLCQDFSAQQLFEVTSQLQGKMTIPNSTEGATS